ncbi:GMP synthase, large subunit [Oleidesulfovibrio alaskensis G20]|jgi:GMP synthase (glutamine-hydrolysing)|uniref:GMP synthase [glutamine-hydrolyzing] n=1 Tax=Oleidesulfovibrio alaskensis (strain ATCC BAA-1058 / DSM 17464 / G20) TaxID=207559 RepID=GUAA_OLEA2|nr:glutamine-hydrolyzing GMP synthase [Oleidesulfovibrio alaskensis]Q311X7.1 RecName: Full=GMP synthase [glutamine-hydrolyzing]; AltName: Full=GMP synthetase; AltName: Full=Glutamine amidotransferase [Oleidesulfovibrio alaskensis G20]ABB38269.1 GMP synthase, large subunit [Oleidesulfovibrio alaskensis G20]MBG0774314.1 glutamine-hydrolyzing GMP synthase [Oleidesulfovibrio alaskensis]MBL3581208.1 glutamine-hydrolyzing GMP synthase [Oleidesulfovibrio alaskensis]
MEKQNKVIIVDYGSQVTQLIARRIREAGVYSEIHPCIVTAAEVAAMSPSAVVLSGGPASVLGEDSPALDKGLLELGVPVLGICYGMQLLAHNLGGELSCSETREYGPADLKFCAGSPLWDGLKTDESSRVWMSHGDRVKKVPAGFTVTGSTETLEVAAMADDQRRIYAVQFHPEVHHSEDGVRMLHNFLFKIAGIKADWSMSSFCERVIKEVSEQVGPDDQVVCALSGGIDSTVVAVLLHKAIGHRLHCIFVDNGVLRLNEVDEVSGYLREHFDLNLTVVDARERFMKQFAGVEDPEKKRKIIGYTFIDVFDEESQKIPNVKYLAQGTLYPDVIESISHKGPSAVIKSHHNVGGLPETMKLKLIEPLRELFKDEVRKLAVELGLPDFIVWRHPFPGPGLAIRVIGEVTEERLDILRKADKIVQNELTASGWYRKVWQGFAVLLPLKTVGVMGDDRTYEHVIALRVVDSVDAMTADWVRLPSEVLERISSRIINEVKGVNRVVYDISSKPPSTIEWE